MVAPVRGGLLSPRAGATLFTSLDVPSPPFPRSPFPVEKPASQVSPHPFLDFFPSARRREEWSEVLWRREPSIPDEESEEILLSGLLIYLTPTGVYDVPLLFQSPDENVLQIYLLMG